MEKRGFHKIKSERDGDKITVTLGEPVRVQSFHVEGQPEAFGEKKMRRIVGEVMTRSS